MATAPRDVRVNRWNLRGAAAVVLLAAGCAPGADGGGQPGSGGSQGSGTGGASGGAAGNGGNGGNGVSTGGQLAGSGGTTGTAGAAGTVGTAGRGGATGTAGAAGNGGTTGAAGTGGAGGTAGASGTSGATGTGGRAGSGGATGSGGTSGTGGTTPPGPALAFPGAQGFGKKATGARNGVVYHVTNLNDAGSGSFRDAVSASNRFVVFDVGGYIQLVTAVSVKSNITIAGQTAPGQGIGFRGGEISFANSSNIICRYIRIRPGSETADDTDDALSLYRARNVMIDHNSYDFAPWNNIGAVSDDWQNYPVTDVTFQDSLIADPTGQQFGAHTESVSSQMAWYRNIFANSTTEIRCPRSTTSSSTTCSTTTRRATRRTRARTSRTTS